MSALNISKKGGPARPGPPKATAPAPEDLWKISSGRSNTAVIRTKLLRVSPSRQSSGLSRCAMAGLVTSTLFLGAIIFLVLLSMQFSIKISKLTNQVKDLAQDNALLRGELNKIQDKGNKNLS